MNPLFSQNLVPNSSFEDYNSLPSSDGDFEIKNWKNVSSLSNSETLTGKLGTPDYLRIDGIKDCKLPNSAKGWIEPKSGKAVVGLITYNHSISDFREYIQVKLRSPLQISEEYIISLAINTSVDDNANDSYADYYSSGLGVYLSETELVQSTNEVLDQKPHAKIDYALDVSDSDNWKILSFILEADREYNYVTIGNFDNDVNTILKKKNRANQSGKMPVAYYFIDDVSIMPFGELLEDDNQYITEIKGPHSFCSFDDGVELEAIIKDQNENIIEGRWSGGSGTFEYLSNNKVKYFYSKKEIGREVELVFSSLDTKLKISKEHTIQIVPVFEVDAGENVRLKYGEGAKLEGSIPSTNGRNGKFSWTGGDGIFTSDDQLATKYYPSLDEVGKTIELRLDYKTNDERCDSHDFVSIEVLPIEEYTEDLNETVSIDIKCDKVVCQDQTSVDLEAVISGSGQYQGEWSGGKGEFNNKRAKITSYNFDDSEIGENVILKYILYSNTNIYEEEVNVFYMNSINVEAGSNMISTFGDTVYLNAELKVGDVKNYNVMWTGGKGNYVSFDHLQAMYLPDISEIDQEVRLKINAQDEFSGCESSDYLVLKVLQPRNESSNSKPSPVKIVEPSDLPPPSPVIDEEQILSTKPEVGIVFKLETINFKADSFKIKPVHLNELDVYLKYLIKYENAVVEVGGHTNTRPAHDYCKRLSNDRANSVMRYFIDGGIDAERLIAKGYGKRKPLFKSPHKSVQSKNQRVELKIIAMRDE